MKITEKYIRKVIQEELQKEIFGFGKKRTAPQAPQAPQASYDPLSMANNIINNAIDLSKKGKDVSGFIDLAIKHLMSAKKQGGEKIKTSDPENVTSPVTK